MGGNPTMIYTNDPRPIRNIIAELLAEWNHRDCTVSDVSTADLLIQTFFAAGLKIEKHTLEDAVADVVKHLGLEDDA
jgi:cyanate lyase